MESLICNYCGKLFWEDIEVESIQDEGKCIACSHILTNSQDYDTEGNNEEAEY